MSATDLLENDLLELLFQNIDLANIGDAAGLQNSATAGNWHISLCTADPGDAATSQLTNESAYTSYARRPVPRSSAGWTVSISNASNANVTDTTFAQCTGTGSTITHFGIGFASSGAGALHLKGALDSSLSVSNGITPSFAQNQLDINID